MTRFSTRGRGIKPVGPRANKKRAVMLTRGNATRVVLMAIALYLAAFATAAVRAQDVRGGQDAKNNPRVPLTSLKKLVVPEPPNLGDFVQDRYAAIVLGKALFWDMQAGSDNMTACATCHSHAGADNRIKNTLNPGANGTFEPMAAGDRGGPNYELAANDFPFHKLANEDNKDSDIQFDSNDVVGSAGVYNSIFGRVVTNWEVNTLAGDSTFQVNGVQTRRVTGRNTPTNINAVLNFRNFWDGRANFIFNGASPFGPRDTAARIWIDDVFTDADGVDHERAMPAMVRIPFASAASQSVGPPGSPTEMAAAGRSFSDIGHKLLNTQPLAGQEVSQFDSVLGPYVSWGSGGVPKGLDTNYASYEVLIQQAFYPEFWQTPDAVFRASTVDAQHPAGLPYRQIEANFSLFWGLAIQLYEETLISDDAPFDRFADGDPTALTDEQQHGLAIFSSDRGRCVNCHKGAEFTGATSRMILGSGSLGSFGGDGPIELMMMGNGQTGYYDDGFYNIGVTPTANDIGDGGTDPWGNPLSFPLQLKDLMNGGIAVDSAFVSLDPCTFQAAAGCSPILDSNFREVVDGSFKTPSLRNVELTGPYFHNGGYATLEQVVAFYSRGGNVRAAGAGDTTGLAANPSNLDPDVTNTGFTPDEEAALVAFLKSLTDERVRWQRAPFDHPQLILSNGAMGDNVSLSQGVRARDELLVIPAVGADGLSSLGLGPIVPFTPK